MFFKGNIYITDPCYIAKDEDWCKDNGFDVLNGYDDPVIDKSLGFTDYLMEHTGIGDGSWEVFEAPKEMKLSFDDIYDIIEDTDNDLSDFKVVGRYCADAGMSCVVYQQEADAYNPDFEKEFADKSHCLTLIKGFEGEIKVYFDDDDCLHFVGIGNKTFFTA